MDFLKKTGGGIHHIKEKIDEPEMAQTLDWYTQNGMKEILGANYYNVSFHYPDTLEKLGIQIELGNCESAVIPSETGNS